MPHYRAPAFVTRFRFGYLLSFWLLAFVFVTHFCFCYSLSKKHECPSLARRMLIYRRLVIPIMCLIGCIPYIYIYCIQYCTVGRGTQRFILVVSNDYSFPDRDIPTFIPELSYIYLLYNVYTAQYISYVFRYR